MNTSNDPFWQMNVGHVLTLGALLLSFWAAHWSNVKRIQKSAAETQEMRTKLDMIYGWFQKNVVGRRDSYRRDERGGD